MHLSPIPPSSDMHWRCSLVCALALLASCGSPPAPSPTSPGPENGAAIAPSSHSPSAVPRDAKPSPDRPPRAPVPTQRIQRQIEGLTLEILVFDSRDCELIVADKSRGPESAWQSAKAAAHAQRAFAAINGGFFTPEGQPLGLVIEEGRRAGSWNRSSSLAAGVIVVTEGEVQLLRRQVWDPAQPADYLLQTGPVLVAEGHATTGLSSRSTRPRSFIASDDTGAVAIGFTPAATLAELARSLAAQPIPDVSLRTALNLDGGTSSDLWIDSSVKGGPFSTRQFFNKPVRNYLLVKRRN